MKLYAFDGINEKLELVPLAARRALDAIGTKLSLDAFLSLSLANRSSLAEAGSGIEVDKASARSCSQSAQPQGKKIDSPVEPNSAELPQLVSEAFSEIGPISEKVWSALSPLDRYSLAKVSQKKRPERLRAAYAEIIGQSRWSTHLKPEGGVRMVSVSGKEESQRCAKAECWLTMSADAFQKLHGASSPKGDVLGTARLAGIMATKKTSDLIPLCHPLALEHADISFEEHPQSHQIRVLCTVTVFARTGVEMEAMVGAQIAGLTIYDMLKSVDRGMSLSQGRLLEKSGGRSGTFNAEGPQ